MFGFFRLRGRSSDAGGFITELRLKALRYIDDSRIIYELTPLELWELITVRSALEQERLEDLYRRNELLAFNIGALCRTAVNAPEQFPKTPDIAFGRK